MLAAAALTFACSSSNNGSGSTGSNGALSCKGTPTPVSDLESESSSFGCGSAPLLHGDAGAGDSCQSPSDCTPTCCACPAGKKYDSALVVACANGKCVDSQTACCGLIGDIQNEPAGTSGPCD